MTQPITPPLKDDKITKKIVEDVNKRLEKKVDMTDFLALKRRVEALENA